MAAAAAPKKRVLMVVTNHTDCPATDEEKKQNKTPSKIGWYLPEVAHPYSIFQSKGYEMIFVSPSGGPATCDASSIVDWASDDDCNKFKAAKMNSDGQIDTVKITDVPNASTADAIFFAGGLGVMWDFPDCAAQNKVAGEIYDVGGIVAAVCHGPAGLLKVKTADNKLLIQGKTVTGFSNDEEEAVKKTKAVPFLLETALKDAGAKYTSVKKWGSNVEVDGRVITGQNPASASGTANAVVQLLDKK